MSTLTLDFHPAQFDIYDSHNTNQVDIVVAGRGFGKGFLLQNVLFYNALTWDITKNSSARTRKYALLTMATLTQAKFLHWEPLKRMAHGLQDYIEDVNNSELTITPVNNLPTIVLKGQDNYGERLRGIDPVYAAIDEAQDTSRSVWDEILQPALARNLGWKALHIGTPNGKGSPFHQFVKHAQSTPGYGVHQYTSYDNPYFPRIELDKLRASLPPKTFNQEILAMWEDVAGAVFSAFNLSVLTDTPTNYMTLPLRVMGIDWGGVNPALAVFGVTHNYDVVVMDTWTNPAPGEVVTQAELFKHALEYTNKYNVGLVFAPDDRREEIAALQHYGATNSNVALGTTKTVKRSHPSPDYRYGMLNNILYQHGLSIVRNDNNLKLVAELSGALRKRDKRTGLYTDEVDKASGNGLHIADALTYALAQVLEATPGMLKRYVGNI